MEEKKLYPVHLCTILDEYVWGSEEFKLADLGYRDSLLRDGWLAGNTISEVMDTYLDRVVGDRVYEYFGRQFPFQVKYIHCRTISPLLVHPNDTVAAQRYDFLGKEKVWVVLRAGKGAMAYVGFRKDTNAAGFLAKCEDGSALDLLNGIALYPGQCLSIPSGTVNCLKGEVLVAEVSESSPMDFCLTTWGQEAGPEEFDPEFNLIEALDFINYGAYCAPAPGADSPEGIPELLASLPQFTVNRLRLKAPISISTEKCDSCMVYNCTAGEASVQMEILGRRTDCILKEGETVLVPAEVQEFYLVPIKEGTELLEVYSEAREPADSYINTNVEAVLPENEQ